jgi:hypothetical protein
MGLLAHLIHTDYPYLGEWYEPKGGGEHVPSYDTQRATAAALCRRVAWMYALAGGASALGVAYHRVRARR